MLEKFSRTDFCGVTPNKVRDLRYKAEVVGYEEYVEYWFTKEAYTHDEEGLTFNYKYAVKALFIDLQVFYQIVIVVMPEDIHPQILKNIEDFSGGEHLLIDVAECGYAIPILYDNTPYKQWGNKANMNFIFNAIEYIEAMIGFYLDKYQNVLGTTGWDRLKEILFNEDCIRAAVKRREKQD